MQKFWLFVLLMWVFSCSKKDSSPSSPLHQVQYMISSTTRDSVLIGYITPNNHLTLPGKWLKLPWSYTNTYNADSVLTLRVSVYAANALENITSRISLDDKVVKEKQNPNPDTDLVYLFQ